ncbi:MAG: two component transcriptional regulator, winged helix family [Anaerospora sp.]|nr:two component transcriptional regulator, winged helix family [Anaerospora sp.]
MRVLVVEDDDMLREAVVAVLQEEFYVVEEAGTGSEGLYKALHILLLTARDTVEDRVAGLEAGADDYLIKPFAVPELLARVKALLRRSGSVGHEGELAYGSIIIQAKSKDAFINEAPLHLTVKEYELLEFLIINREQILTREQIYDRIWGLESDTTISIVDLYIHYLRKKLAPYGQETLIQTIRGAGFILKEN